jgi:serine/threonine-protein kinase
MSGNSETQPGAASSGAMRATANAMFVQPGQVIGGKFRIEQILGEGGMGIVVAATHLQLREPVALKFLRREFLKSPQILARFRHEARAVAKLRSDHVCRVLDVGEREDGTPYMVMEHLEGRDLGAVLSDDGAQPVLTAVEYIIQVCDGLAEAHARRIVHLDIKPENIFLVERDGWRRVKVLDFGISKAALIAGVTPAELAELETGERMGSPHYMSPEQIRGGDAIDLRSDIWSLGAVLFELLAGVPPFDSDRGPDQIMRAIVDGAPRSLLELRPEVPVEIEEIVRKCLRRDRDERFANAAELAIALLPYAPRRARAVVERAVLTTKSAGLAGPSLEMPASVFPNATESDPTALSDLRMAPPPSFSDLSGIIGRDDSQIDPSELDGEMETRVEKTEPATSQPPVEEDLPPPPDHTTRNAIIAFGIIVGAVTASVLFWPRASTPSTAASNVPAASATPSTQVAAPAATAASAAPQPAASIHVAISATPKTSKISIDNGPLLASPLATTFAKDASTHTVHVESPHFQPKDLSFSGSADTTLEVVLEAAPAGYRPPPRSQKPVAAPADDTPPTPTVNAAPPPAPAPEPTHKSGKPKRDIDTSDPYAH